MTYFVDTAFVAPKLSEFLTKAKAMGFQFVASVAPAGPIPRLVIKDITNAMTWTKNPETNVTTFYSAGIPEFSHGDGDPQLLSIVCINIDIVSGLPAFSMPFNQPSLSPMKGSSPTGTPFN